MSNWSTANISNQNGKTVIVTGANSGIGFYTAFELGRAGAFVIVACRDKERGQQAVEKMRQQAPNASFAFDQLDLANLASIRNFSADFLRQGRVLDILINNAGVMALPTRQETVDGFEVQFGTNHLGHFALTGLLLPALHKSVAPRVVTISSGVAFFGKLEIDNLQSKQKYAPMKTYAQSKLANLLFMEELGRQASWLTSVAAHPGSTITNLQKYQFKTFVNLFGQHAAQGALPSLRAAVDQAESGTFYAPKGFFNMRGAPVKIDLPKKALDKSLAGELWCASEELTAVQYGFSEIAAVR